MKPRRVPSAETIDVRDAVRVRHGRSSGPNASAMRARTSSPLTKRAGRQAPELLALGAEAARRHELDEADLDAFLSGEADEIEDLVVVDAADDDRVDLDRGEPGRPGGLEARRRCGRSPSAA